MMSIWLTNVVENKFRPDQLMKSNLVLPNSALLLYLMPIVVLMVYEERTSGRDEVKFIYSVII